MNRASAKVPGRTRSSTASVTARYRAVKARTPSRSGSASCQLGRPVGGGLGREDEPEELIAAAHASCFAMALSNVLAKAGHPPERLETSAVITFVAGTGITKSALSVKATVPGLDADGFRAAAEDAKTNCPVSQALAAVPEITLDAQLDS